LVNLRFSWNVSGPVAFAMQTAKGVCGMGRSQEYRLFAARCLEIARATADEQTRAVMLQMAQVWSRLADEIEAARRESAIGGAARE
jgi:hypothetical protein